MANAIHFDTIGSTFQDELRSGFAFQVADQKDDRDVLLHLAQEVQHLRFSPVWAVVLGHNKFKELRTESFGELLGSHHYIRADRESHPLEFIQAALDICYSTIHKEDSHEILSALICVAGRSSFHLLEVMLSCRRHVHA